MPDDTRLHNAGSWERVSPNVAARITLFSRLVDDAALFPPARDPMAVAVAGHLKRRQSPHQWIMGRFLCPVTRIAELQDTLDDETSIELGLIMKEPGEISAVHATRDDPRLRLTGVELGPAFGDSAPVISEDDVLVYQEVDREEPLEPQLDRIADQGLRAKLRTGGLTADAFPPTEEVASFIEGATERDIGYKCTAGLHHALPYTDPETGFDHHGFLNIILATHQVLTGGDPVAVLQNRVGKELDELVGSLTPDQSEEIRARYHGHGSCVFSDAADDLVELGLV